MRKLLLGSIVVFASSVCHGQLIDNKINIYFSHSSGRLHGKEILKEDNFVSPSLFVNYKNLSGFSFKGLIKTNEIVSLGTGFDYSEASGWELQGYNDYFNSTAKLYSLSPIIQLHNKLKETGLSNRLRVFIEIAPTIGISYLTLTNPLFDIQSNVYVVSTPLKNEEIFFGARGDVGFEIKVTGSVGLSCSYSRNYDLISSKFYNDNHFSASQFFFGAFVRLRKDKRFYH